MAKLLRVVLGVHAHWAGEQWNARGDVLGAALELALAAHARHGAACALDVDGRGLEEAAARTPRVLEALRDAIRAGSVEVTGASFAQPEPLLYSGESGLRQRLLGARTFERLLGSRPRAIWEGAPPFFPQSPQIQLGLGVQAIALVPAFEEQSQVAPLEVRAWRTWRGLDGSAVPALAVNPLSLAFASGDLAGAHDLAAASEEPALLLAWVPGDPERAEHFWRALEALRADPRFTWRACSFTELVRALAGEGAGAPASWGADAFFAGGAPAKNSDVLPRAAALAEEQLLAAESLAASAARLGVGEEGAAGAPGWKLEESWRELCLAQHHSIRAREELRGGVAAASVDRAIALAEDVHSGALHSLSQQVQGLEGGQLVLNPLGWARDVLHDSGVVRNVPPYGYKVVDPYELEATLHGRVRVRETEERFALVRGRMRVEIDRRRGVIEQITTRELPDGVLDPERPLLDFSMVRGGREDRFGDAEVASSSTEEEETDELTIRRTARGGPSLTIQVAIEPLFDAVWLRIHSEDLPPPDPGARAALGFELAPRLGGEPRVLVDHAFGVGEVRAESDRERASVGARGLERADLLARPFQALRFVDLSAADGARGVLYVHDGSSSFARVGGGLRHVLSSVDPLEPDIFDGTLVTDLWIVPHAGMTDPQRVRRAMECTLGNTGFPQSAEIRGGGSLPSAWGALEVTPDSVLATAFWLEAPPSEPDARPFGEPGERVYALRLVEYAGQAVRARVRLAGMVSRAARTDLLGEVLAQLPIERCDAAHGPADEPWSEFALDLRAHEIATVRFQ